MLIRSRHPSAMPLVQYMKIWPQHPDARRKTITNLSMVKPFNHVTLSGYTTQLSRLGNHASFTAPAMTLKESYSVSTSARLISESPGRKPYSLNMREQIELTSPRVSILTCYNVHINTSKDERDPTTSEDKNDPIPALIPTRGYPNRTHRAPNCLFVMYLSCYYCIFLHCYLLVYLPPTCNCKLLTFVYHCHLLQGCRIGAMTPFTAPGNASGRRCFFWRHYNHIYIHVL